MARLDPATIAGDLGLVITPAEALTIERRPHGRGFTYVETGSGDTIKGTERKRLDALVLPPAWTDVRIAADDCAHLQAIGTDQKSRTQYRYHELWAQVRETLKTERLRRFGRALPAIREAVERDLKRPVEDPRGVVATAVRLIDRQLLRIGNERYARDGTRGASTLRKADARLGDGVELRFRAKAGKKAVVRLRDRKLKSRIRKLGRARAPHAKGRLFVWRDEGGKLQPLKSDRINAWLVEAAGAPVSAKDFRSFAGSAMALRLLCLAEPTARSGRWTPSTRRRAVAAAMRVVAERLRNTPAVTRSSYVHPSIVTAFMDDRLGPRFLRGRNRAGLDEAETALMRFLEDDRRH